MKATPTPSASPTGGAASGDPSAKAGLSPVWWLAGLAAVGAVYAASTSLPQQQVQQTKQHAEEFEISPGQHAALTEAPPQGVVLEPRPAPTDASSSQETSTVTGQALGPQEVFHDKAPADQHSQAQSHSTFHTDELAMPSSKSGQDPQQPGSEHDSIDKFMFQPGSLLAGNDVASALSKAIPSSKRPEASEDATSDHASSSKKQDSNSSTDPSQASVDVDIHSVDRAHDSGLEASASIDPTPMTDLLNEALTGEMLHPEHPGHEHTTLDNPHKHDSSTHHDDPSSLRDDQSSSQDEPGPDSSHQQGAQNADGSDSASSASGDSNGGRTSGSDDYSDDHSRESRPKRQWAHPPWAGVPETGVLLQEGFHGPDEVGLAFCCIHEPHGPLHGFCRAEASRALLINQSHARDQASRVQSHCTIRVQEAGSLLW